jgi:hypothetical protein
MESQPGRRSQLPVHAHSHPENGQTFLRFTEQLNQHHDAEQFLLALPSLLHNLVPANTFMVFGLGWVIIRIAGICAQPKRGNAAPARFVVGEALSMLLGPGKSASASDPFHRHREPLP